MNNNLNQKPIVNLTQKDLIISLVFLLLSLVILFSGYIISMFTDNDNRLSGSRKISNDLAKLGAEIDKIPIDTNILSNRFLNSTINLPVYQLDSNLDQNFGKSNPFSGSIVSIANLPAGIVGGARYNSQTSSTTTTIITAPVTSTRR